MMKIALKSIRFREIKNKLSHGYHYFDVLQANIKKFLSGEKQIAGSLNKSDALFQVWVKNIISYVLLPIGMLSTGFDFIKNLQKFLRYLKPNPHLAPPEHLAKKRRSIIQFSLNSFLLMLLIAASLTAGVGASILIGFQYSLTAAQYFYFSRLHRQRLREVQLKSQTLLHERYQHTQEQCLLESDLRSYLDTFQGLLETFKNLHHPDDQDILDYQKLFESHLTLLMKQLRQFKSPMQAECTHLSFIQSQLKKITLKESHPEKAHFKMVKLLTLTVKPIEFALQNLDSDPTSPVESQQHLEAIKKLQHKKYHHRAKLKLSRLEGVCYSAMLLGYALSFICPMLIIPVTLLTLGLAGYTFFQKMKFLSSHGKATSAASTAQSHAPPAPQEMTAFDTGSNVKEKPMATRLPSSFKKAAFAFFESKSSLFSKKERDTYEETEIPVH